MNDYRLKRATSRGGIRSSGADTRPSLPIIRNSTPDLPVYDCMRPSWGCRLQGSYYMNDDVYGKYMYNRHYFPTYHSYLYSNFFYDSKTSPYYWNLINSPSRYKYWLDYPPYSYNYRKYNFALSHSTARRTASATGTTRRITVRAVRTTSPAASRSTECECANCKYEVKMFISFPLYSSHWIYPLATSLTLFVGAKMDSEHRLCRARSMTMLQASSADLRQRFLVPRSSSVSDLRANRMPWSYRPKPTRFDSWFGNYSSTFYSRLYSPRPYLYSNFSSAYSWTPYYYSYPQYRYRSMPDFLNLLDFQTLFYLV
ncbi:hypothetical protein L596_002260 [Steinernema carpocapsae]|uniref:Uncharacterized protein n=1 Tax=Steinernema carpocapsae TaxID=34508 RepID=A0A4U8USN8_STECR|nr:hypothetical protein L596_002260 [Steinernema carpocapsae]